MEIVTHEHQECKFTIMKTKLVILFIKVLMFVACTHRCTAQLLDSILVTNRNLLPTSFFSSYADTLVVSSELNSIIHVDLKNGRILQETSIPDRKRGCDCNRPFLLSKYVAYSWIDGYAFLLGSDNIRLIDLWKSPRDIHKCVRGYFNNWQEVGNALKPIVANYNLETEHYYNGYYQDSALLQLDLIKGNNRKFGKRPSFMMFNQAAKPVFNYQPLSLQVDDTVYLAYSGHPKIYKYINGVLVDSTKDIDGYPNYLIAKPRYFTESELKELGNNPNKPIEYRAGMMDVRLVRTKSGVSKISRPSKGNHVILNYDNEANFLKSEVAPFTAEASFTGYDAKQQVYYFIKRLKKGYRILRFKANK